MRRSIIAYLLSVILAGSLAAQSNADDFWLGNGFSDGDTVFANSGWFYDDGGNGQYHQGQDWTVTICSENIYPITLDFSDFATHFGGAVGDGTYDQYDYMTVEFPDNAYYVYHDDTPEFSFTSQSQCIDVGFISDNDGLIHSGWNAEIYAVPPPDNNDPTTAQELIVGNVCSPSYFTNKGAYNTTDLGNPPCKEYFGGDVWFRLEVPASGEVKIETFAGTLTYAILDIYRSNNSFITVGERIACVDDGGSMPTVTLSGASVNPGDILYIRLFGEQAKSGLFGICVTDPSQPVTGYVGPGGVGDDESLGFWYKIDKGVLNNSGTAALNTEDVRTWEDQSGNNLDLIQTTTTAQATLETNVSNDFSALHFDGSDVFELETGLGGAPMHMYSVGEFLGSSRQTMVSIGDVQAEKTASISRSAIGDYYCYTDGDLSGPALTADQYYIFQASHENSLPYHFLEVDGASQTVDAASSALEIDGSLQVGDSWDNTEAFNGRISELIYYKKNLNEAQQVIVDNYLAAKYDLIAGSHDYYAYKNSYQYDLAGIGRVDEDNMHTKAQSAGVLSISGANALSNGEYLFVGHNAGDFITWNSTNVPAGDTNIVRLDRVWRTSIVDSPGTISIGLDLSELPALPTDFSSYNILVDDDGDFSSGAIAYSPYEINGELVVNNVSLSHGDFVAIAAIRPYISFVSATSSALESVVNPAIEVVLNYPVSTTTDFAYVVTGATATQGTDYSLLASSISINPGDVSAFIIPLIIEDDEAEIPDEYFDIEISSSTAGVVAAGITTCRHTILNNDLSLELLVSDTIIGECSSSQSQIIVIPEGNEPFTYAWLPTDGLSVSDNDTVMANPSSTTTYTVEVTDGLGLSKSTSIEIEVVPLPVQPTISLNDGTGFCQGDSVELSAPTGYDQYLWSNSSAEENIWVNVDGTYNLIVIDSFGCLSPVSADVEVSVYVHPEQAEITIDGSDVFCEGDSTILRAPEGYASYTWFDHTSTADSLVVKSTSTYALSVSDANGCESPISEAVSITVHDNPATPVITAVDPLTFCSGGSVSLNATTGFDSYNWTGGGSGETNIVTESGAYRVMVEDINGCISDSSAAVSVTVNPLPAQPVITIEGSDIFCEGDSTILRAPEGYTSYTWFDHASTADSLVVKATSSYALSVKDINGCESPVSEAVSITVNDNPTTPVISADGAMAFCFGESVTLEAPSGFVSYSWTGGGSGATKEVTESGAYKLVVEDANGCFSDSSAALSVTVYDNPVKPMITIDGPTTFCAGDSAVLKAPEGYASYTWSDGSSLDSLIVKTADSYSVAVGNANGCDSPVSDAVSITVNDNPETPVISADGALSFCFGESVTLEAPSGFVSYSWTGGGSGATNEVTESGAYKLVVEDANACFSDSSAALNVIVFENPEKPVITIDGSTAICNGDSAILKAPEGYASYTWSDGSSLSSLIVKTADSYSVSVSNANGCDSPVSDAVSITVNDNPETPVISADGALAFCFGEAVTLEAPSGFVSYSWTGGGTGATNEVTESGDYKLVVEDANGCFSDSSAALSVTVNPLPERPIIIADGPLVFLTGDSVNLSVDAATSYEWAPNGETNESIWVKLSGDYSVQVRNEFGCQSLWSEIVSVEVSDFLPAPDVTALGALEFCDGGSVSLEGPEGVAGYLWSNGMTERIIVIDESDTLSLVISNDGGVESLPSDEFIVQVYELPQLSVGQETEPLCKGDSNGQITYTVTNGAEPYAYYYNDELLVAPVLENITAGTYSITVKDNNGCSSDMEVELTEPDAIEVDIDITNAYCPDISDGSVNLEISGGISPYTVWWDGGENSAYLDMLSPADYSFQVRDGNNCLFEGLASVTYLNQVCFEIPEIITPNGDSYNDTWRIEGLEVYTEATIEIFDRWGKRVFFSEGHDIYFDGTFNGKELPMESYHYVINLNNGSDVIIGNITIVR